MRSQWKAGSLVGIACAAFIAGNASWSAPPRYDGAGYAVLARALLERHSYRAIDHPEEPRHAHFPPGYPFLLAGIWKLTGTSVGAAHVFSVACTIGAAIASWWWMRRLMASDAALILGVALSVNWLWARTGSAILSEPLYMLLCQSAVLVAISGKRSPARTRQWIFAIPGRKDSARPALPEPVPPRALARYRMTLIRTIVLGVLLAGCLLTRHIAIGLVLAVLLDRALARRWGETVTIAVVTGLLVLPWVVWMAAVGSDAGTQVGMMFAGNASWPEQIGRQLLFYIMRIPDTLTGPVVEVGTSAQASGIARSVAGLWGLVATAVIAVGLVIQLSRPRMRLIALIPILTVLIILPWPFTEAGRFLIPLVPCLLVAGVEGLAVPLDILRSRRGLKLRPSKARRIVASLLLAVSLPYSVYATITGRAKALEASQRDFDSACRWLAQHGDRPGAILSRHPGEVFWQTGRQGLAVSTVERPTEQDADSDSIARTIAEYHVAYLLIDRERYARAPQSPLARFVHVHPYGLTKVWEAGELTIYEVLSQLP
jgi:hypothetical protein